MTVFQATETDPLTVLGNLVEDEDVHKDDQRLGHGRFPFKPYLGVLQKMKMYTRTTRDYRPRTLSL
jgi:hypothetical protein